jgi:hypothetical protein
MVMPDFAVNRSPAVQPGSTASVAEVTTTRSAHLDRWAPGLGVAAIWLATLVSALFAPDLVTGSQQEHFPLVGAVDWLWAAVAAGYVLMVGRFGGPNGRTRGGAISFVLSVTAVWAATAVASIFGPPLLTGTDPTQIPLVAILAPLAAMAVTGFICLHATTRQRDSASSDVRTG